MDPLKEHTIPFTGLKDGSHAFTFQLGADFFAAVGDEAFEGGEVDVQVRLDKTSTMLVTNIHVAGPVRVHCDHCDGLMDLLVKGDQRQIFQLHGDPDQDDDELVTLDPAAHSINLTHYIYECLRLALPARKVHPAGQCDPEVEKVLDNLTVEQEHAPDPRWDALKQLKTKRP
jgi:uncharacterized metal-binding protein YceD (DUF177 family)